MNKSLPFPPPIPVQAAVLNGFCDVFRLNILFFVEVGDCPADLEDFIVGPGGFANLLYSAQDIWQV